MNKISEQAIAKREEQLKRENPVVVSDQQSLQPVPTEPDLRGPMPPARRERAGSIKQIATAIATVTGEIGVIPKLGYNKFFDYKFARQQDIIARLNKLMASNGLVIVQSEISRQWVDGGAAISITYDFTIAHSSGEMWPERPQSTGLSRCRDSKGGFDDKSINKCHTAARKYFLISLFQIATGDEDDADAGDNEKPRKTVTSGKRDYPSARERTEVLEVSADRVFEIREPPPSQSPDEDPTLETKLSLEDQARAFATKGEVAFGRWYVNLDNMQKRRLTAIGDELRGLINDVDMK